jgi:hypothetical protein
VREVWGSEKKNPRMASQLSRIVDYEYFLEFNITHNYVESMNVCKGNIFFSNTSSQIYKIFFSKNKKYQALFLPPPKSSIFIGFIGKNKDACAPVADILFLLSFIQEKLIISVIFMI